jgi:hypothetical protein
MQPYQTYYMPQQQMQYQSNPYEYYRGYGQMQNNSYQQAQQAQAQRNEPICKVVDDFGTITANDVSMQGASIFAKRDLSEVQIRSWMPNGTIGVTTYKPILDQNNNELNNSSPDNQNALYEEITKKLDTIMEQLNGIEKPKRTILKKEQTENE